MSLAFGLASVAQASDAAGQPVSRALFGVAHLIAESARNVKVNNLTARQLSRRVNEFVTVITTKLDQSENDDLSDEWLHALAAFQDILSETCEHLRKQESRSYLIQVLRQEGDAAALNTLLSRTQGAFDALMVGARMRIHEMLEAVNESWETSDALDELTAQTDFIHPASSPPESEFTPVLPPRLHTFFGRNQEVDAVVNTLVSSTGARYVAILGGPGMGKTSLAMNVLHIPAVIERFGTARYFIACDSADAQSSCVQLVSAAFGLCSSSSVALRKRLAAISRGRPALMVLDNFESPWEPPDLRQEAEQLLQVLSDVPLLSIIITLRGTERPLGLSWTRPFLPPLRPLRDDAALMTFVTISDKDETDAHMKELMSLTENVPLALVLMSNLAQYETTEGLLSRWNELNTSMLMRGNEYHRLTSLDTSITLSLQSHRISSSPNAAKLLGLLSLVPNGVMGSDLVSWTPDLDASRAASTLIQTALAYRTSEHRIRVLAPIRSFVLSNHPPDHALARAAYDHYFELAELVFKAGVDTSGFEAVSSISPELENVQAVIRYALKHSPDPRPAVRAAVCMCRLYNDTGLGGPSLLHDALDVSRREGMDDQTAALLHQWALMSCNTPVPGDPVALFTESRDLHERIGNIDGVIDLTLHLSWYCPLSEALETCQKMRDLADSRGDRWRVSRCDMALGRVWERLGDRHKAREYLNSHTAILRAEFPTEYRQLGWSIFRQGDIAWDCGDSSVALEKMRESIPILQRANYLLGLATAEYALGDLLFEQGYVSEAIPVLESALHSCRIGGFARREISCLHGLSNCHLAMGDANAAEHFVERADELLRGSGNSWSVSVCGLARLRARIKLFRGDTTEARAVLDGARMACRVYDSSHAAEDLWVSEALILLYLGKAAQAEGANDSALVSYIASAVACSRVGLGVSALKALSALVEVVDDPLAEFLIAVIHPPLVHLNLKPLLGEVFLYAARVALRRGAVGLARHRAQIARRHYEETNNSLYLDKVQEFLRQCVED